MLILKQGFSNFLGHPNQIFKKEINIYTLEQSNI